ncbi:MAG: hypothetical protein ACE5H9_10130 [Anaerolineae bacterium]
MTYAASNHEFDAEMVQAILAGVVANPYIMRELPALLRTSGLQIVSFYSNVLAEARAGQFFSSLAEAYVPAELESLSGMTGAQLPFGQGSNLFEALTLVSLSDHSLAKATQTMGAAVRRLEAEWLAHKSNNGWLSVQSGCTALWMRPKSIFAVKQSIPGVI